MLLQTVVVAVADAATRRRRWLGGRPGREGGVGEVVGGREGQTHGSLSCWPYPSAAPRSRLTPARESARSPSLPVSPVSRHARGLPALHVACYRTHHTSTPFRYPAVTSLGLGTAVQWPCAVHMDLYIYIYMSMLYMSPWRVCSDVMAFRITTN